MFEDEVCGGARLRRADQVIGVLFERAADGQTGRRLQRICDAEGAFRRCFEQHGPAMMTDRERLMLGFEQQLEPVGAVARLAGADVVLLVMRPFLDEEQWHGVDAEDRRLRVRLIRAMVRQALTLPELRGPVGQCAAHDVRWALERARLDLARGGPHP